MFMKEDVPRWELAPRELFNGLRWLALKVTAAREYGSTQELRKLNEAMKDFVLLPNQLL
jgi:hypothetical protein